ncbi:hypothetical protein GGI12_002465 [Dipsacomyces acuminosporus]|nr:hypothetical protein GGI12_002465 [Dipsacomyces acuminosporus]
MAAQMLARSMPAAAEVKPYTLTVDAIQALSTKPMHREAMAQIGSMIFTKNSRLLDMVPESVVTNLFEMLYRQRYYCNIISFMQHLPPNLVNADIVRTTLMALRKQQVSNNLGSRKYKARSREVQTRLNLHKAWEFVMSSELKDPIVSAAHKAIDALCKRSPTLLSSMHLTKLLEIELGSIPAELPIPRSMHLWLSNFQKHNIDAGVQAFTVIINAYMGHGDTQFAMQIFEQMQRGTLSLANPDGTSSSIHVPAPNEVTIASVASVWCRGKSLEKVKRVLGHIAKHGVPVSERLVTRVVSEMVDKGCLADAECIWREYGYVETRSVSDRASKRHVVNTRALAKLVLGFSRAESIHKALELFEIACESEHRSTGKAHAEIAHLTGLFNTVLRCALDATEPGPFSLRLSKRSISDVIGIALKYGVRYDTATYNVFLARLSRVAGEHMPKVGTGDEADANQELLKEAATTMHQLYLRMHSEGLAPDDTTLLHLIPAWTYLHQHDLAVENWLLSTQGRQSRKIERVKRHIMSKARLWNVESKTLELLEAQ